LRDHDALNGGAQIRNIVESISARCDKISRSAARLSLTG
jgi:hypothetical protein